MGRLGKISIDPVLTELTRGEKQQTLYYEKLFPNVVVSKEHGKVPAYLPVMGKDYKTERALRAGTNLRLPGDVEKISFSCTEHDMGTGLDYRELEESDLPLERREAYNNQGIIEFQKEKTAASLATDAANFYAANKLVLSGTDLFDNAASNPIKTLQSAISALKKQHAADYDLNIVISAPVWDAIKEHSAVVEKIKYSMLGVATPEILKQILDLKNSEIVIADSIKDGSYIWGKNIVIGIVPKVVDSVYTPSFGYTFRKKGFPVVDTYDSEDKKLKYIRYTDCFDMKIMNSKSGFLISNCIS